MNRESNPEYREALHSYGCGLLRLCGVLGVSQADIARHCGVSRPLVTHWKDGLQLMPPKHEYAIRHGLIEAVDEARQGLRALDSEALRGLRDGLIPALVDLDGSALAMTREYVASVRAMNRDIMAAVSSTLQTQACTGEVAEELRFAYDSAQETLAALQSLWPRVKARNRGLKELVVPTANEDIRAHVEKLLSYVKIVYGVQETTSSDRRGSSPRRKAGQRATVKKGSEAGSKSEGPPLTALAAR